MPEVKCYISSDNDIVVKGLRVARTGAPANAATVTASLLNSAGSTVSSSSTTLDYVTNSLGTYFGSQPQSSPSQSMGQRPLQTHAASL
jgi:hypothetical protein